MDSEYIYQDVKRMKQRIDILGLSQTARERLYWSGCKTLGKLSKMTVQDLLKIYGIGNKYCSEIVEKAAKAGIIIPDLDESKEKRSYSVVSKVSYPQNLLMDLLQCDAEDPRVLNIDPDRNAGISVALSYLDERSAMFVVLRYKQCATYEEIGNYYGVSGSRVQQLVQEALKKLRRSFFQTLISKGLHAHIQEIVIKETQKHVEARLKAEYLRGYTDGVNDTKNDVPPDEKKPIPKIESLLIEDVPLSVRSFNCLKRSGIVYLADILRFNTVDEIMKIRNMGKRSIKEIAWLLQDYGITGTVWDEFLRESAQ